MEQPKAYSYIRFSTSEQEKGDSLRRQTEATERYCKEKGLTLDTSLSLQDLGLSAYHGTHKTKGSLGVFLQLVEQGKIPKGSVLIVENLDRLSRGQVLEAFNQFSNIIQAGITIVTLMDGMEYSQESINQGNWVQLIISIVYMARAWDESERKSQRVKAAWDDKRIQAVQKGTVMTQIAPYWLLKDKSGKFVPIPEVVKAVQLIFEKKLEGKGAVVISSDLNQMEDIWRPPKTKRNRLGSWNSTYILRILQNPAVIGEFQPHETLYNGNNTRERKKIGAPMQNYYPPIINPDMFEQVQEMFKNNKFAGNGKGGGKTGAAYNIFSSLVYCGFCHNPMHYLDKDKDKPFLHCKISRRKVVEGGKRVCEARFIDYKEFERLMFDNLEELNLTDLFPTEPESQTFLNDLKSKLNVNTRRLNELNRKIENVGDALADIPDKENRKIINDQLTGWREERNQLTINQQQLEQEYHSTKIEVEKMRTVIDTATEVYGLLNQTKDAGQQKNVRLRLRAEVRKLISIIEIYPLTEPYREMEEIEPGIYRTMHSKFVDKVRIRFKGSSQKRLLFLKRHAEIL